MLAGVCRGARSANSCFVRPWMLMTLKSAHRIVCTPENVVVEKRTPAKTKSQIDPTCGCAHDINLKPPRCFASSAVNDEHHFLLAHFNGEHTGHQ